MIGPDEEAAMAQDESRLTQDSQPQTEAFDEKQKPKPSFQARVTRMSWAWFPSTMATGAVANLLSQQPYTFAGLKTIGKIFYIIDIAMFVTFSILIAIRFALKPRALPASLHHPSESFFFGSWWASLSLILSNMASYGVEGLGSDSAWLIHGLRVLFWMYFGCILMVAVFQYHIIFYAERLQVKDAIPAWVLPAYSFISSGPLAAAIAKTQPPGSAAQMIVAGISGQGLGWMIALLTYGLYYQRLVASDLPGPSYRPGMFASVGPASYTCAGLLALGQQAIVKIPPGFAGLENDVNIGTIWLAIALPASLFLWMTAIWFSGVSAVTVLRDVKHMRFTLIWWAFVFPNCGLAVATIQIGTILEATGIKAAGSALTVIIVALWLLCAILHVRAVWICDLLAPGKDPGVDAVNLRHDDPKKYKEHLG